MSSDDDQVCNPDRDLGDDSIADLLNNKPLDGREVARSTVTRSFVSPALIDSTAATTAERTCRFEYEIPGPGIRYIQPRPIPNVHKVLYSIKMTDVSRLVLKFVSYLRPGEWSEVQKLKLAITIGHRGLAKKCGLSQSINQALKDSRVRFNLSLDDVPIHRVVRAQHRMKIDWGGHMPEYSVAERQQLLMKEGCGFAGQDHLHPISFFRPDGLDLQGLLDDIPLK